MDLQAFVDQYIIGLRIRINSNPNRKFCVYHHPTYNVIVIGEGVLKVLNKEEIKAVIAHEIAHALLKHNGSTHENELAADKYSIRCGGNYNHLANALVKMTEIYGNEAYEGNDTHPSLNERLRNIGY